MKKSIKYGFGFTMGAFLANLSISIVAKACEFATKRIEKSAKEKKENETK